jgi:hypothetical protein
MMADDLDISPLAAEIILQALRHIVYEHFDLDESRAPLADLTEPNESDGT